MQLKSALYTLHRAAILLTSRKRRGVSQSQPVTKSKQNKERRTGGAEEREAEEKVRKDSKEGAQKKRIFPKENSSS